MMARDCDGKSFAILPEVQEKKAEKMFLLTEEHFQRRVWTTFALEAACFLEASDKTWLSPKSFLVTAGHKSEARDLSKGHNQRLIP